MTTEKRLIDANGLMEEINKQRRASMGSFPKRHYVVGDVLNSILNAPTVDAAEVVHGRWDRHASMVRTPFALNYDCSICGEESSKTTNYCPNCGAKMDLKVVE